MAVGLGLVIWFNSVAEPFEWGNKTLYDCKETWSPEAGRIFTCAIFVITFALPMTILTFAYGSVALKMFRHSAPGNADLARDEAQHNAKMKVFIYDLILLLNKCLSFPLNKS
jgi:hypothetical protein